MTPLQLATLGGCGLRIGAYPGFSYDARGGGGQAQLGVSGSDGRCSVVFDPAGLTIPPLTWRTTRFLGLPLPPGLCIAIEAQELAGSLDPRSGGLELRFTALFHCSFGRIYRPPALRIATTLATGRATGQRHRAEGTALQSDGSALLVGVARVEPSGDAWLDRFLGLPDEALAALRCRFSWPDGSCAGDGRAIT
ncbi:MULTISPECIES: hypothetical protein [Aphanothece]|uniref:hypothetical protein n=1 Tax=Aphanothece TaxID=1121 RepID=UPI0039847214